MIVRAKIPPHNNGIEEPEVAQEQAAPEGTVISGNLEAFSEQGTEGAMWCILEPNKTGYEGLHVIENGHFLRIFNNAAERKVIWSGTIDLDFEASKKQIPGFAGWIVQRVDGIGTVHGVQRDVDPTAWGKMFIEELPAELILPKPKP